MEPRFSRAVNALLSVLWFAGIETFGWATLDWTHDAPFLLFAFGFCITVAYHLGACVLLSRAGALKVTFLYFTFFQNVWTAVFILQNILSRDTLTWKLVGLALNAVILPPFVLYLKRYYVRVCHEVESGYGLAASVAAVEFFIMSRKGRKLAITCLNACRQDVTFKDGLPTVVSGHSNGIGVKSILHAVKKYGGDADFSLVPSDGPGLEAQFKCAVILDDPL